MKLTPKTIKPIDTTEVAAPIISLMDAAELTGIPNRYLRNQLNKIRIGNADYVQVADVNRLLLEPKTVPANAQQKADAIKREGSIWSLTNKHGRWDLHPTVKDGQPGWLYTCSSPKGRKFRWADFYPTLEEGIRQPGIHTELFHAALNGGF